jgi:hypothetical protein
MSIHTQAHHLAGKTVAIVSGALAGSEYRVEDWWDRLAGKSWMYCDGNPACIDYALRSSRDGLPTDDDVVYGKVGPVGKLVHVSQLEASDK